MTEPLLSAEDIHKSFGNFEAVRGVDLDVMPGEIVGLLGANGAGKTTFMRCALGIAAPTSGTSQLFGQPPSIRTRARLGYVPQGRGLYPDLTVRENQSFAAAAYGVQDSEQLADKKRLVRDLPLGDQRRIAFHIALAHRPELLILDEPTSGVGPLESAQLWEIIGEQAAAGVGVLVTTHNMAEASQCDRLALMVDGVVAAKGSEADIIGDAKVVTVACNDWQQTFDALVNAGHLVSLAGRSVRVLGSSMAQVSQDLDGVVSATVGQASATLDERMALLGR